jgi:hypothetical protein
VLSELAVVEFTPDPPACRVLEADRTDLGRSAAYRACGERLAAIERALAADLPTPVAARAA